MPTKKILFTLALLAALALAKPTHATNAWDLPPLLLPDIQGNQHSLYDWHGRVILLNFWASWCGPCMVEIPHLIEYQRQYGKNQLQVVSVGLDDLDKLKNVTRSLKIPYPVLYANPDKQLGLLTQWGDASRVLPYTVVIDRDGTIVFQRVGIFDDEAFELAVLPLLESTTH